jgi:hypothetical protein
MKGMLVKYKTTPGNHNCGNGLLSGRKKHRAFILAGAGPAVLLQHHKPGLYSHGFASLSHNGREFPGFLITTGRKTLSPLSQGANDTGVKTGFFFTC